jgi:hypothetical protein
MKKFPKPGIRRASRFCHLAIRRGLVAVVKLLALAVLLSVDLFMRFRTTSHTLARPLTALQPFRAKAGKPVLSPM